MTKKEAIEYCQKYRNQFIADAFKEGEDGVEQYECLIVCLESGHIKPEELSEYGMKYD